MITIVDPDPEYDPDPDFRPDRDARREFSVGVGVMLAGGALAQGVFGLVAWTGAGSAWAFAFPVAVVLLGASMLLSPEWPRLAAGWQTVRRALRVGAACSAVVFVASLLA